MPEPCAGTVSGGGQAMVSISRRVMVQPRLLIVDAPSPGLSPLSVKVHLCVISDINRLGLAVWPVEPNVRQPLAIAHDGEGLSQGRLAAHGTAPQLNGSVAVRAAYFG